MSKPSPLIIEVNFAANTLMLLEMYKSGTLTLEELLSKIEVEQTLGVKYLRAKAAGEFDLLWHELKARESA